MSMHPARQAYVEEENGGDDRMEGIDYASVRTFTVLQRARTLHS
jgi:hypothetical protein